MSDMVPEILNAALDSLFTPKEPGEREYQGEDGLLYCRNCHTPVQCRVKLWGRDRIVPCLCRCQQEAMAEKKRQDELVERQRKIRQLKATGIQEKHLSDYQEHIKFLRNLQELRSSGTGHRKGKSYQKISKVFDVQRENYAETFSNILENVISFLNYIETHFEELSK